MSFNDLAKKEQANKKVSGTPAPKSRAGTEESSESGQDKTSVPPKGGEAS